MRQLYPSPDATPFENSAPSMYTVEGPKRMSRWTMCGTLSPSMASAWSRRLLPINSHPGFSRQQPGVSQASHLPDANSLNDRDSQTQGLQAQRAHWPAGWSVRGYAGESWQDGPAEIWARSPTASIGSPASSKSMGPEAGRALERALLPSRAKLLACEAALKENAGEEEAAPSAAETSDIGQSRS